MNISCRKNLNGSFMVISEFDEVYADDYSLKMVMSNRIPRLLNMKEENVDGKKKLLYDITSLDSLENILKNGKLTVECLNRLLRSLKLCADQMNRYLLDPDLLILQPECIYTDPSNGQFSFCFFPFTGEDRSSDLRIVFDRILSEMDYEDRKLVRKVYELNSRVQNQNFSIRNLCDVIVEEENQRVRIDPMFGQENRDAAEQEDLRKDSSFDLSWTDHTDEPGILAKLKQYFQKRQTGGFVSGINGSFPEMQNDPSGSCRQENRNPENIPADRFSDRCRGSGPFRAEWKSMQEILQENCQNEPVAEPACENDYEKNNAGCIQIHRLVGTGRQQGNVIEINKNPFVIGKLENQADYLLCESVVSRIHARICFDEENVCFLEDLNSLNGTYINGTRITSRVREKLQPGDLVALADQEFVFN